MILVPYPTPVLLMCFTELRHLLTFGHCPIIY